MVGGFIALNHHIINLNFHQLPDFISEHFCHQSLVGCPTILQPKWHYPIVVKTHSCDEGCAFLVGSKKGDFMVIGIGIKATHSFMTNC